MRKALVKSGAVMGHTQCGAIVGATGTYLANQGKAQMKPGSALEGLLTDLSGVIKKASDDMGPGAPKEKLAAHAVKACCCGMLVDVGDGTRMYSEPLRELISSGKVDLQGWWEQSSMELWPWAMAARWLPRVPHESRVALQELLAAKSNLPPSMQIPGPGEQGLAF
eukprot:Skav230394  [mRNA]  locus=scaffold62:449712:456206:- [translate_table: standard]